MSDRVDMKNTVVVVPCFNEAHRLDPTEFMGLVDRNPTISLLFVDDGSTDDTPRVIDRLAEHPRISSLILSKNSGKAEAIRRGFLAIDWSTADWVGYVDADLATPPSEIERLISVATGSPDRDCVFGSRVRLCGSTIERRPLRHAIGRIFAGLADHVLGAHVYDTQAGAKFFRATPGLVSCIETPFSDRWSFDVELLGRLGKVGVFPRRTLEVPLQTWTDKAGSKVSMVAGLVAMLRLLRIRRRLRRFAPSR